MPLRGRRAPKRQRPPKGAERRALADLFARAREVRLLALDVDGVLTDGTIWLAPDGAVSKRFDIRDGHALVMLPRHGVQLAIVSGRRDPVSELRARELGFGHVLQGVRSKLPAVEALARRLGIPLSRVAYMGDDLNDLAVIGAVGLGAAPADAAPETLSAARFVASRRGGRGAVRELAEVLLKARGAWQEITGGPGKTARPRPRARG